MLCRQLPRWVRQGVVSVPTSPVGLLYYIMGGGQFRWGGGQQTFPTMGDAMILLKLYNVATWLAGGGKSTYCAVQQLRVLLLLTIKQNKLLIIILLLRMQMSY